MEQKYIHPEELNIAEIFCQYQYIIPIYQRNYAWKEKQILQLLDDIYDSDGKYYIGSLIVDKIDTNSYAVVDGQQRLTTVFLLLSYLKHTSVNVMSLRFEAREKSNRTIREIINNDIITNNYDVNLYSAEIFNGYAIIKNYFEIRNDAQTFKSQFTNKLSDIEVIRTQVPAQTDLNHYFEIMNTRGEQLELHEIAKGRLLSKIDSPEERNIASIIWDACSQMDNYIQMSFDKNIREKIFGNEWNIFNPKNFNELFNCFDSTNDVNDRFSLKEKLDSLKKGNTNKRNDNNQDDNIEKDRFESIISFPIFLLIVNEALDEQDHEDYSLDDKRFLNILKLHWDSNETAKHFIYSIMKFRFYFDTNIIKREYTNNNQNEGKWSLQKLEYNANDNISYTSVNNQVRLLQSALRITYTSPKTMHWISLVLQTINSNENCDLIKVLEKYACQKVQEADYKNAKGFATDRIIFTYLDYLLLKREGKYDYQFSFRSSIEHFAPQHSIDKDKQWNQDDLDNFGNLALITVSANSKFSNLSPKAKVDTYPDVIKQSPKLEEMSKLMSNKNWTPDISQQHKNDMLKLIDEEIRNVLSE